MGWSLFTLVMIIALAKGQETCLSVEEEPYLLFGTKTAYIFANRGLPNKNRVHEVPGCEPAAFWLLSRHGSHNPESGDIEALYNLTSLKDNILNNYKNGNFRNSEHRMCTSDLNLLERWSYSPRHNQTFAGDLTSDGYISTQQLAQAWKQKYPGLLTDNKHNYLFKYTNDRRSTTSFRAFTEGLFKTQADEYDLPKENDEKLLRPYKFCDAWKNNVEDKKETLAQKEIFESKMEYKEMLTNVSLRLGFNYDIEPQVVHSIYQMCRYNKAWDVTQISPWCAAFSREDLKRLEYAEDLETFYKYGHGTDLNKKIGCAYLKDMMTFFNKHVQSETPQQPRVSIHLAEDADIMLTLDAFGNHQDSAPLTGDNYHTGPMQSRKWSTSTMVPFNGNVAAVLYKCTLNGNFQINEKYQVLFLENEKPISFEGCRVGLCDWSRVNALLGDVANSCSLEVCNGATRLGYFPAILIIMVSSCLSFFVL